MFARSQYWSTIFLILGLCALGVRADAQTTVTSSAVDEALDQIEGKIDGDLPLFEEELEAWEPPAEEAPEDMPDADIPDEGPQEAFASLTGQTSFLLDVLELKDMDIIDVLKLISKKSGLNIIAGKNVRGKVTIYLKDVDVRDALKIILEANGMAFVEEGGIIKVMTAQDFEAQYGYKFGQETKTKIVELKNAKAEDVIPLLTQMKTPTGTVVADPNTHTLIITDRLDKILLMETFLSKIDVPLTTVVFDLKYAKAEDVVTKVEGLLSKNIGKVEADKKSNKLFVTDTPGKVREITSMINAFDEKPEEVLIEAKILQITLSDQYKMGVDWQAIVRDYHTLDLNSNFSILGATDKSGKLEIGSIDPDDYDVLIEALETVGETNTLSNPRITAVNNEEAKILVGSTEPYVTSETITPASGPTTTSETINFIDVGVKLYVTPTIHGDGFVTMKIRPEVSSVSRYLTTSTNNEIPVVETSQAETTVTAKDGATIVIGGLIKDEKINTVNKVPILGDIPLLGFAFRNTSNRTTKTELVIFLTPKIVTGEVSVTERLSVQPKKK